MATVLQFDHDVLMSGRSLRKPINFVLSRIVSPRGVVIDLRKRPVVVVVDPRAGQGPGIIGAGDRTTFAEREWIARNCWRLLSHRVLRPPGVQSRRAGR